MNTNQTEYLNNVIAMLRAEKEPELWLILPCDEGDNVIGAPIFILKTEEALRRKFSEAVNLANGNAIVAAYWIDI